MKSKETLSNICQICIVTRDVDKMMERYRSLGVGPFKVYSMDTREMEGVVYRGRPADYSLKVAWAKLGSWTLEIIEPIRGENIYTEYLDKHGAGIHHLGIYVDDYKAADEELARQGYKTIQGGPIEGLDKTGRFDYYQTEKEFGVVLELLDFPEDIGEPDYIYPKDD